MRIYVDRMTTKVTVESDNTDSAEWCDTETTVFVYDEPAPDIATGYSIQWPRPACMRRPYPGKKYTPR